MSRKLVVFLCVIALAASGATLLTAQPSLDAERAMKIKMNESPVDRSGPMTKALPSPRITDKADVRRSRHDKNTPVTIIYDDGIVTAVPAVSSFCYGNQFDSASGVAVKSFSVTNISAFILTGAGSDNVFVSVFGGPGTGTTAPVLGSPSLPLTAGSGAFNNFSLGPYAGGGSFLAGIWYIGGDTVGLGSGTVNGQGHHGMLINDIVGTGFATLGPINALVGASTAFIPVELMDFTVTDN